MEAETTFGQGLRQRRRHLDLTQAELAQQVGCAVVTIRKLEADEIRPSKPMAERLAQCLGIMPEHYPTFTAQARLTLPTAPPDTLPASTNLPTQLTPFIGRAVELAAIADRLHNPACRLLTIVGPGGMGKTRLALQAAGQAQAFAHGVYVVFLAPLLSAELLASAILDSLNAPAYDSDPTAHLLNYLADRQLLLVLDNFEHLLAGTDLVTQILRQVAGIKLLVTSRERLNLQGEWLLPLTGLSVPAPGESSKPDVTGTALQLFVQSACRVQPGFALIAANRTDMVRICQLVEGMPLGIELAATWVRLLDCQSIVQEIEKSLDFLSTTGRDVPLRHRSMRAVFEHSWRLLADHERSGLCQLSVFRGGFTRAAAESVAGVTLAMLSSLVDKSWVQVAASGRYNLHELVRQYTSEQLESTPSSTTQAVAERVRQHHSAYYSAFLQAQYQQLFDVAQRASLQAITTEIDNIRLAWHWAVEHVAVDLISASIDSLLVAADRRGWYQEIEQSFARTAASLKQVLLIGQPDTQQRQGIILVLARVLTNQGRLCARSRSTDEARHLCEEGLALLSELTLEQRQAQAYLEALKWLAYTVMSQGNYQEAESIFQEMLPIVRATNDHALHVMIFVGLSHIAYCQGEYGKAEQLARQSLADAESVGNMAGRLLSYDRLTQALSEQGRHEEAEEVGQENLRNIREFDDQVSLTSAYLTLGQVEIAAGNYSEAQRWHNEALLLYQQIGNHYIKVRALNGQGMVALCLGNPTAAQTLFTEAATLAKETGRNKELTFAWVGLGHAHIHLNERKSATEYLHLALHRGLEKQFLPEVMGSVTGLAALQVKMGRIGFAVELLAFVLHHPTTAQITKGQVQYLLTEQKQSMPPTEFAQHFVRGQQRQLDEVIGEILLLQGAYR